MARIPVRIESAEEGKEFQKFIFARGWRWKDSGIKIEDYFRGLDLKLLYFLYTNTKTLIYSNISSSSEDYKNSISVKEAKKKFFGCGETFMEISE